MGFLYFIDDEILISIDHIFKYIYSFNHTNDTMSQAAGSGSPHSSGAFIDDDDYGGMYEDELDGVGYSDNFLAGAGAGAAGGFGLTASERLVRQLADAKPGQFYNNFSKTMLNEEDMAPVDMSKVQLPQQKK